MRSAVCAAFPYCATATAPPWRAPGEIIDAVRAAEAKDEFDERAPARGDKVTMRKGILCGIEAVVGRTQSAKMIELLIPLFNSSVRATVASHAVMRA